MLRRASLSGAALPPSTAARTGEPSEDSGGAPAAARMDCILSKREPSFPLSLAAASSSISFRVSSGFWRISNSSVPPSPTVT